MCLGLQEERNPLSIVHRIEQQHGGGSPSSSWDMAAEVSYKIGIYRGLCYYFIHEQNKGKVQESNSG
jgi:hypothetical protein